MVKVYSRKGDFFGELALRSGSDGVRKATVTCTKPGGLVTVDRATFRRLLGPLDAVLKVNIIHATLFRIKKSAGGTGLASAECFPWNCFGSKTFRRNPRQSMPKPYRERPNRNGFSALRADLR